MLLFPFLALLLTAGSPAPPDEALPAPLRDVRKAVLDNGLTVLLAEDRSSPLVSVGVMYAVGARNEAAGSTGLAHYVEHMNFRATRNLPGSEITEAITRIGGRWNGYTWIDQTYYAETVPRDALDRILDLEADRMANALYDPEDFRKERTSVIAELHSYDDPHSVLYDAVLAASFEIHPYRHNTIGWLTDVEQATRDEAYRFYRRFYHPNNAVLVVVGDMDPDETLEKVRLRFAALPPAGEPTAVRTVEPPQPGQRRVTVRLPGPHAEAILAFRAPALTDPDFPAMVVFDALLAGGKGFRFHRDEPAPSDTPLQLATVSAGLATEARSDWQPSRYPYVYTVSASAAVGEENLHRLEKALFRALSQAVEREWTDDEIRSALRQVRTGWASDVDDKAGRAHQLAFFEVSGGYRHLLDLPSALAGVTRADLRRFTRERLRPDQATVGWFVPGEASRPSPVGAGPTSASASRPSPDRPPTMSPPARGAHASFTLGSGIRVALAPTAGAGLVALRARIEAGSAHDGAHAGLSALATELLSQAAPGEPRGSPGLAFTLHEEPESFTNFRWIEASGVSLAEDLPALLGVLAGRLRRAAQPLGQAQWRDLQRTARERAEELSASAGTSLWQRALAETYPEGTPLASPPWGRVRALQRLRPETLRAFLRHYVVPSRLTLALAGAVDPSSARAELETTFGRWTGLSFRPSPSPPAPPRGAPAWREVVLRDPTKAQNEILVVWPGDRSKSWDRAATQALLYLLGETGYAGRLGRALVDPGLVYSVEASLEEEEGTPGFLAVRTAAAPGNTREVLGRIRSVLEDAARGPFDQAQLDEAKVYLRGKAARSMEGAAEAAATALSGALVREAPGLETLTLEQLDDTARRLFGSGAPVALVAGPGS